MDVIPAFVLKWPIAVIALATVLYFVLTWKKVPPSREREEDQPHVGFQRRQMEHGDRRKKDVPTENDQRKFRRRSRFWRK